MLARIRTNHLNAALIAALVTHAMVAAWPAESGQASQAPSGGGTPAQERPAILRGRVTDEAGAPLADVRIRVAIPAADMRFVDLTAGRKVREARSDPKGDYRLELSEITARTTISIDATKPGYRRLAGPLMSRSEAKNVEVGPGTEAEASLVLKPALYVSGTVVDEHGRPIPGVVIAANASSARTSAAIDRIASRPDGSFELFNYPVQRPGFQSGAGKGVVHFSHPDYIARDIDDVYALTPRERETLRIALETGYKVTGTVRDAAGKPVPKAMIKVIRKDGTHRKATLSDANGQFVLRGVSGGLTLLTARAVEIRQNLQLPMALNGDKSDLELRLKPIRWPAGLEGHEVLGMRLTDVTPELKATYDLFGDRGALILDPGKNSDRLKIGRLEEGDVFWMVGRTRVGSVREFVKQILAETAGQDADEYTVRVVYNFSRVDFDGSRTATMRFTREDRKQLQVLSDQISPESP
jgi:protocatechuate 3,4-dioxygenase beta subunit